MLWKSKCVCCIIPPHMLEKMAESPDPAVRARALASLQTSAGLRAERQVRAAFAFATAAPASGRRTIFDCRQRSNLSTAVIVRSHDAGPVADQSVNRAYDGLKATYEFYQTVFGRDSIDNSGMRLDAFVHYGFEYNNAFWDGQHMVFGDGDGAAFSDFTGSLDVIGHELTHGVTEFSAGLIYHNQPGALNESMSDVFGSLVKQWTKGQTADQADWLIGPEVFTPSRAGDALRSMKAPGTAYDNPDFGKDPQPDHMDRYKNLPDTQNGDWGGVHINSGIPNKAFYLFATALGGNAWERPGQVWYEALKASSPETNFQQFAETTYAKARALFTGDAAVGQAVREAWAGVGINIAAY